MSVVRSDRSKDILVEDQIRSPYQNQSGWDRLTRKFIEEPFVPLGVIATCIALGGATQALRTGDRVKMNRFLRYRVAAQGLTVLAAVGGSYFYMDQRTQQREKERAQLRSQMQAENAAKAV